MEGNETMQESSKCLLQFVAILLLLKKREILVRIVTAPDDLLLLFKT